MATWRTLGLNQVISAYADVPKLLTPPALALVAVFLDYDWEEAGRQFRSAMARDPVAARIPLDLRQSTALAAACRGIAASGFSLGS